jgi:hypothetical protein
MKEKYRLKVNETLLIYEDMFGREVYFNIHNN